MIDPAILPSLSKALGPGYMDIFASLNATPAPEAPAPAVVPTVSGGKKKSKKRSPKKSPRKRMTRRRVLRKSRK